MLTESEQAVLRDFRRFRVTTGQMLCFNGPQLERHREAFRRLTDKGLLIKDRFGGGYSLTPEGLAAVKACA